MSEISEDPRYVTAGALQAAKERRLAFVAPNWHEVVAQPAAVLTSGTVPAIPTPSDSDK
jgi:hypothetical protein